MILAEMGISQNSTDNLGLKPQFSSDFMSFSDLQKEIDEKCLRQPSDEFTQVDEAAEILDEIYGSQ
jgi:hypothetical protein